MRALPPPVRNVPTPLALALAAALLAGCGSSPAPAADRPVSPSPAAVASPAASAAPSAVVKPVVKAVVGDPLTGRPKAPGGSVVAVKIDNSPLARPYHRGLDEASVIYQELMEGGSSRFLAIYAPATGNEVGPVRSVREGDLELLQQYGKVALAGSGGNTGVLATFAQAAKEGRVLDANFEVLPGPYRRAERRRDAYNFFTSPQKIDQAKPGGAKVKDVGLRFGPLAPTAGFPAQTVSVSFSPISRVRVEYDPKGGRYAVYQDGDRMKDYAPTNVVVQQTKITNSRYVDVVGNPTPFTTTIGSGSVTVLRDGRRLSGTWRRLVGDTGTRFLDDKGRDLPLKPGATLVLLVPAGRSLQVG
ncbi:MAG: yerB [Frankiales bacterium]|nr:yerB [Frankiales bacterium]